MQFTRISDLKLGNLDSHFTFLRNLHDKVGALCQELRNSRA